MNCGQLGVDWAQISLPDYVDAVAAHNESVSGDSMPEASDWLRQRVNNTVN